MDTFTLIVPYYRQPKMLEYQIREWNLYPENIQIIVVDDGSPRQDRALNVVTEHATDDLLKQLSLYEITVDVPWNRGCARNLGAQQAQTEFIMHVDTDHVLRAHQAEELLCFAPSPDQWYRFQRFRCGTADDTRKKDKLPNSCPYGLIHPHIDSYLISKQLYWKVGGYDEDYSGCLGGGTVFLKQLTKLVKPSLIECPYLEVVTRSVVNDSSISTLDRSHAEFRRRQNDKVARSDTTPKNPIRCPWEQVL